MGLYEYKEPGLYDSSYIRAALVEFSDKDAKDRMQAVEEMASLCRRFKDELGCDALPTSLRAAKLAHFGGPRTNSEHNLFI